MDEEWEAGDRALVMTRFGDLLEARLMAHVPGTDWWQVELAEINVLTGFRECEMIRQVTR